MRVLLSSVLLLLCTLSYGKNHEDFSSIDSDPVLEDGLYRLLGDTLNGYDPRHELAKCDFISASCKNDLKNQELSKELLSAYGNYSLKATTCMKNFIHKNCWDDVKHKWKQGECNIGDACLFEDSNSQQLDIACANNGGDICNGIYKFGIQGSYVRASLPACTPKSCDNDDDMEELSQCVNEQTCSKVPGVLVTACKFDFGCHAENNFGLIFTYSLVWGSIILFLITFVLAYQGKCSNRKPESKKISYGSVGNSSSIVGEQRGLLEGLGLNVPLTGGSMASNILSPDPITAAHREYIVEGTPHILNTASMDQVRGGSLDNGFMDESENNEQNDRPRYKLSQQFENHIINGFKFRRNDLQTKGVSGWGAGSTSASSLVWRSLFYKTKGNQILRGVSGYIKPGMCVACIGAPDSGATTLLKLLAGRITSGKISGEITLDGYPPSENIKKILAFIPKEDLNLPTLTVRETLEFSLEMRAPSSMPQKLKEDRVNVILSLLGLSHVADTIVGNQLLRGISGGEKRRVSLGVELVVGRSLLLASQPTNGLDSSAAYDVIKATRALSDTGLAAFMATISQPSPELLALFDTTCIISRGSCIYFGPTNEAERFFLQAGFACPPNKAISDFLEEISGDADQFRIKNSTDNVGTQLGDIQEEEDLDVQNPLKAKTGINSKSNAPIEPLLRRESIARKTLVTDFRKSQHYNVLGLAIWNELDHAATLREKRDNEREYQEINAGLSDIEDEFIEEDGRTASENKSSVNRIARSHAPKCFLNDEGEIKFCGQSAYTTGLWFQFKTCIARGAKLTVRSPTLRVRTFRPLFMGAMVGSMFFQADVDQIGANSRFGLIFLVSNMSIFGQLSAIPEQFSLRSVYYAQKSAGYFRPLAYLMTQVLIEFPQMLCESLILSTMIYTLVGLNGGLFSWNFLYFWITTFTLGMTSYLLCFAVIMCSPSAIVAQGICPTFISLWILFCGYLVPHKNMVSSIKWLYDINPLSRSLKGLTINEVEGLSYYCKEDQLWPPPDDKLLSNYTGEDNKTASFKGNEYRTCPMSSGGATLFQYGLDTGEQDKMVLYTQNLVFPFVLLLISLIIMHVVNYESDSSDSAGQMMEAKKKSLREERKKMIEEKKKKKQLLQIEQQKDVINSEYGLLQDNEEGEQDIEENNIDNKISNIPSVSGCIEFNNLNYTVDIPQPGMFSKPTKKQLLHDISGYAQPGSIVALMGASGAGKSTLLDVLADKKTGGYIDADLKINGSPRSFDYPRFAGYVEQSDSHLPTHTVREAIETSAKLRLPSQVSKIQREKLVNRVINQLGLEPFENKLVGVAPNEDGIPGVSPEIRKKTTIAVELAMDPALLFLDEPTTGLDASSALNVMLAVKKVCKTKATMVTIHQPSAEVFSLFDWMLLLQKGGRVVYFGPIDQMNPYFSRNGFGECPMDCNPADFALTCSRKELEEGGTAADIWENSNEKIEILDGAPSKRAERGDPVMGYGEPSPYKSAYATSFFTQFVTLLGMQFRYLRRDTAMIRMRVTTAAIFGALLGVLFYHSGLDVPGAQARVALCFICITYVGYSSMLVIPQTIDNRPVYFRESQSHYYTILPYFLAVTLAEIPFIIMQQFCFLILFYPFVGLRTDPEHVAMFVFGMFMLNMATSAFSGFMAFISPNSDSATIVNNLANSIFTLFCGFLLPYNAIPSFWKPLYYISMFRYPLAFLVSSEMHGREFKCPGNNMAVPIFVGGEDAHVPPFPLGNGTADIQCMADVLFSGNITKLLRDPECFRFYCPVEDADMLLKQYNFPIDQGEIWASLFTLVGFYFLWRLLGYFALRYIQHIKR